MLLLISDNLLISDFSSFYSFLKHLTFFSKSFTSIYFCFINESKLTFILIVISRFSNTFSTFYSNFKTDYIKSSYGLSSYNVYYIISFYLINSLWIEYIIYFCFIFNFLLNNLEYSTQYDFMHFTISRIYTK